MVTLDPVGGSRGLEASDRHTVLIIPNDPLPLVRTVLIDPVSVTWHSAENIYRLSLDLEKVKLFPSNLELELPFSLNCPCSLSNVSSEFSLFFIQFFNYNELQIPFNSYVVYLKKSIIYVNLRSTITGTWSEGNTMLGRAE